MRAWGCLDDGVGKMLEWLNESEKRVLCLECLTRAGRECCESHPQGTEKESTLITGAGKVYQEVPEEGSGEPLRRTAAGARHVTRPVMVLYEQL